MKRSLKAGFVTGIFLLFASSSLTAAPQFYKPTLWKAPLVWLAGAKETPSFKELFMTQASLSKDGAVVTLNSEGSCELSQTASLEGVLKSVTVTWAFTGAVTLEVTPTGNAKDYVRVVNGVPYEFKEKTGSQLKWRAILSPQSTLSRVAVAYTNLSGVIGSFGNEKLSGFATRKQIFIQGSQAGEVFHYQVRVKVGESSKAAADSDVLLNGGVLSDFRDVRFTLPDGETLVPHFLEAVEGQAPDRTAVFWINVPQIPEEGISLYLYFGKAGAEDLSKGDGVFDFYDDFEGSSLDPQKWMLALADETAKALVSDSQLLLEKAKITSASYKFDGGILEFKARTPVNGAAAGILRAGTDGQNEVLVYASVAKGSEHAIAKNGDVVANDPIPVDPSAFHVYGTLFAPNQVLFQRFNEQGEGEPLAKVSKDLGSMEPSAIGLSSSSQGAAAEFSWIRTRKYCDPTPQLDVSRTATGILQRCDLPKFENVVTSPVGELVLKDGQAQGSYLSQAVTPGFPVRILKAGWTGALDEKTLAVSIATKTDGDFSKGWENGVTRFVSKKEFERGEILRWRADLKAGTNLQPLSHFLLEYYPGTIRVVLPSHSSVLASGKTYRIFWDAPGFGTKYPMELFFSVDGGKEYQIIGTAGNTGDLIWNVPDITAEKASVKVADSFDKSVYGVSEGNFPIQPSSVGTEESVSAASEAQEAKDYLLAGKGQWAAAASWAGAKIPDLSSQVNIATAATVEADKPAAFHSLVIGDGVGNVISTVILKKGVMRGSGEILIRKGGRLIQEGREPIVLLGDLSIQAGGLLAHASKGKIQITAKNIELEPGSKVDAEAKNKNAGGVIELNATENFNISGTITASGDKKKGGKGGLILLSAGKFGGEGAMVYAEGGKETASRGFISVKGKGTISGVVSVNVGSE